MKELDFITVDGGFGGDQNRLATYFQRLGGCGAVTAADLSIYLSRRFPALRGLYPGPDGPLTQTEYQAFFETVKPFLHPRIGGIARLKQYTDGFADYAASRGVSVAFETLPGGAPVEQAEAFVRRAIDRGLCPAFLLLLHDDPALDDITWHWFLLTGYEDTPAGMQVAYATWGKRHVLSLPHLWNTGHPGQGGLVVIKPKEN